ADARLLAADAGAGARRRAERRLDRGVPARSADGGLQFRERAGTGATRLTTLGTPVTSKAVAEAGYRAYQRNQRVLITGLRNRILARVVPYLPRRTILDITHRIQSPL
ncbi:MAG: hypothetical protein ACREI8_07195, partial [Myxococcota bacterium]